MNKKLYFCSDCGGMVESKNDDCSNCNLEGPHQTCGTFDEVSARNMCANSGYRFDNQEDG